jgi:hypothetical protein
MGKQALGERPSHEQGKNQPARVDLNLDAEKLE